MKYFTSFLSSILIILTIFFILLGNVGFHKSLIQKYQYNESLDYHLEVNRNVTKYLFHTDKELNAPFTENEKSHMKDVKNIITILFIITLSILISLISSYIKKKPKLLSECTNITIILFSFLVLGGISSLFFKPFFHLFHKILFPQGNWMFPADSLMIQTYNRVFFQDFMIWTFIYSFGLTILLLIIIKIIQEIKIIEEK